MERQALGYSLGRAKCRHGNGCSRACARGGPRRVFRQGWLLPGRTRAWRSRRAPAPAVARGRSVAGGGPLCAGHVLALPPPQSQQDGGRATGRAPAESGPRRCTTGRYSRAVALVLMARKACLTGGRAIPPAPWSRHGTRPATGALERRTTLREPCPVAWLLGQRAGAGRPGGFQGRMPAREALPPLGGPRSGGGDLRAATGSRWRVGSAATPGQRETGAATAGPLAALLYLGPWPRGRPRGPSPAWGRGWLPAGDRERSDLRQPGDSRGGHSPQWGGRGENQIFTLGGRAIPPARPTKPEASGMSLAPACRAAPLLGGRAAGGTTQWPK
jgi:hypothetical protein